MDTPKISKLLRLMKLLTGNVSRTIDSLAKELGITPRTVYRYIDTIREAGFVVNKLYGNVYQMGKVNRGLTDFKKLIYFTDDAGVMNRSVVEVGGEALVVSQFTLVASTKKRIKNNLVHLH